MNLLAFIASVTITWTPSGELGITKFILREEINTLWSISWEIPANVTTQTIEFDDYTPRTFKVSAANSAGEGPSSNEISLQLVTVETSPDLQLWMPAVSFVDYVHQNNFLRLKLDRSQTTLRRTIKW